jgi:hypothetical protein
MKRLAELSIELDFDFFGSTAEWTEPGMAESDGEHS